MQRFVAILDTSRASPSLKARALFLVRSIAPSRLWDLGRGAMLAIYTGESQIRSLAVTRAGTIVAGEQSGRVHFLRIQE